MSKNFSRRPKFEELLDKAFDNLDPDLVKKLDNTGVSVNWLETAPIDLKGTKGLVKIFGVFQRHLGLITLFKDTCYDPKDTYEKSVHSLTHVLKHEICHALGVPEEGIKDTGIYET